MAAIKRDKVIADAEKLVAKGKIEPAIKEYERLLDDNPNDVNTLNRIGDLWVRINRTDEAVKTFGRIADHYAKDGFFLKAIAIYKKINKLDPSKLDVYAKLADLYAKQGLAMEAKSQYQVLADYYIKHGDPGNALMIYKKIAELDPSAINVHVKLADLHSQAGQTGEALKEYDRVGRMLLKRGMLEEAVQVFKKALKIDAKNVDLVESLVTALIEARDFNNAQSIVETALEANKNHPKLLATWARILIGKGDINSARSALENAIKADPNEPAAREALAELYLKQNNLDKALENINFIVERALGRGDRPTAVDALNKILKVDPGHIPTLERLVAAYTKLNEETNILASMNTLAEAHIAKMRYQQAAAVLEKLIQREPQNAQHRTKLQFVKSQIGGVDTMPPGRKETPAAPMPSLEIEEPVPTLESLEDEPSLSLETEVPTELDLSGFTSAAAPPPPTHLTPAVEIAADEQAAEGGDDLDFITEHLTEAEVFAKYGLAEKAAEHLRAIIERAPKHLAAHEKLYRI
ncbi:MAG TPA: tetratricopeptide repeat protein, partial [Thermoanaerobaculia bacterium]|nr:tetratricopeptide repeat protein [Thermoanaerobaculia bacterium]